MNGNCTSVLVIIFVRKFKIMNLTCISPICVFIANSSDYSIFKYNSPDKPFASDMFAWSKTFEHNLLNKEIFENISVFYFAELSRSFYVHLTMISSYMKSGIACNEIDSL